MKIKQYIIMLVKKINLYFQERAIDISQSKRFSNEIAKLANPLAISK